MHPIRDSRRQRSAMKFAGIRALISGGASGLGQAVAARLVADGGQTLLLDLNPAQGAQAAAALGARAVFHAGDVTDESAIEAALAVARERFGGLDLAVNCAGIGAAAR